MDPLLVLTGGAALAALLGALRQRTAQLWREQAEQARELGLRVTDLGRWVGRHRGVYVVVQVDTEPHDPWSVRAKLPFLTPRGFSLGPSAHGHDARVLRSAVGEILERIAAHGWRVELGPAVILRRPRQFSPFTAAQRQVELASAVKCVVALVRHLQRRYRELVDGAADLVVPPLLRPIPAPMRTAELRGVVDGVAITVIGPRLTDEHWTLEVRGALLSRLPAGTRVRARPGRHGEPQRRRLLTAGPRHGIGDLVLDHALCAESSDREALGRRLARDRVRGPVLDVLAAHPASELRADEVVHVVHDGALDVEAAVRRVVELVTALRATNPATGDHATA